MTHGNYQCTGPGVNICLTPKKNIFAIFYFFGERTGGNHHIASARSVAELVNVTSPATLNSQKHVPQKSFFGPKKIFQLMAKNDFLTLGNFHRGNHKHGNIIIISTA